MADLENNAVDVVPGPASQEQRRARKGRIPKDDAAVNGQGGVARDPTAQRARGAGDQPTMRGCQRRSIQDRTVKIGALARFTLKQGTAKRFGQRGSTMN